MIFLHEWLSGSTVQASKPMTWLQVPVHSGNKANMLVSLHLQHCVVSDMVSYKLNTLALDHRLVDAAATLIITNPHKLTALCSRVRQRTRYWDM
jgi:isocitrate/isopropylmalate dehydrogenase